MGLLFKIAGAAGFLIGCYMIYGAYSEWSFDQRMKHDAFHESVYARSNDATREMIDGFKKKDSDQDMEDFGEAILVFMAGAGFVVLGSRMSARSTAKAIAGALKAN